jgi:hypothetical protein
LAAYILSYGIPRERVAVYDARSNGGSWSAGKPVPIAIGDELTEDRASGSNSGCTYVIEYPDHFKDLFIFLALDVLLPPSG